MADETQQPSPAATVTDIGGGTARVTPTPPGETNPTLEEQSLAQDEANKGKPAVEGAEAPKPGEEAPKPAEEAPKPKEGEEAPKPVDFTGTVFEGLSPEMQGKIAPYAVAFQENGTLTDAEVTEAAQATGFSEAAVKQFMAGAANTAAASATPIYEAFGGAPQFQEFKAWSAVEGNLTPSEEKTINKAIEAQDFETAAELMKGPQARWKADGGGKPARDITREAQGGKGSEGDNYASWAQVKEDMANPKYDKDPAFRAQVRAKISRSPNI